MTYRPLNGGALKTVRRRNGGEHGGWCLRGTGDSGERVGRNVGTFPKIIHRYGGGVCRRSRTIRSVVMRKGRHHDPRVISGRG